MEDGDDRRKVLTGHGHAGRGTCPSHQAQTTPAAGPTYVGDMAGYLKGSVAEIRHALEAFQRAIKAGDLHRLLEVLAPDVVLLSDGAESRKPHWHQS